MDKTDYPKGVLDASPQIGRQVFIADTATVIGDVILGDEASVWYGAVLRGDINCIVVGAKTNIQDGCVLHVENDRACVIGNSVTVGHRAILHGCNVEDGVLVGMGATVLNGAVIGQGSVIGAGAVVKENMVLPAYSLVVGVPARHVRVLDESVYEKNLKWAEKYCRLARRHAEKFKG